MDLLGLLLKLVLDTSVSWARMFVALGVSVALSIAAGVWMATSSKAEKLMLPVVDVLQTIPILAFFPFAIYIFVAVLPGYIGINAAVVFLIITSMVWNMILGVYESIKTIPKELAEVARLYHFDIWRRLRRIYMPACFPRLVEQSILSWSIGLFYLVTSEIFSIGNKNYQVGYGIGPELIKLAQIGGGYYLLGLGVFIAFVILTRFLFFRPLEKYATKYTRQRAQAPKPKLEKRMITWLETALPRRKVEFDEKGFLIDSGGAAPRKPAVRRRVIKVSTLYTALGAMILLVMAYVIASSPTLRGYEIAAFIALAATFARVWLAFLVTLAIAVPVCVYIVFMSKRTSQYMLLFQIVASVPATVLLPAIALAIGGGALHGEVVAFIIFLLSGIWYVIFSVVASVKTLPSNIFEAQKTFGIKGWNAWKNIYLKAIVPGLITGAMTGIASEWNASIVAEYFTSTGITGSTNILSSVGIGIGKLLDLSLAAGNSGLGLMVIALLNLVVMILLVNTFVWKRFYNRIASVYR